jgi:xylulokinase
MSLMGLDIGTTGTKATIFDEEGRRQAGAYREYPMLHPRPGWMELDPERVWRNVKEAVSEAACGARGDPVKAFAISVLGEASVPVAKDGTVLGKSILGFDSRTSELFDKWIAQHDRAEIMRICGQPPSQMFSVVKLMWIKRNQPDLYRKMARYVTFDAFAHLKMGLEPRVDYSMAARTMAFDIHKKEFSRKLCKWAGVRGDLFSPAVPTGTVVGELRRKAAKELGLPTGCLVVAGSHDQPAGALGSGVTEPRVAMDATGTVECFAVAMKSPVVNETMLKNNLACYPHAAEGLYVALAFNFTGGSLFRWLRDNFARAEAEEAERTGRNVYDLLIEQMSGEPTDLLIVPHFMMTGTPHMDGNPVGAVVGLTLATRRAEFLRAALEGIGYEMKLNVDILRQAGVEVDEFRAIGGGAKSDFWLQLKADMYNRRVVKLAVPEAASLGMAIAAGLAAGVYSSASQAAAELIEPKAVFVPDRNRARYYDEKLAQYRELYGALKEWQRKVGFRCEAGL